MAQFQISKTQLATNRIVNTIGDADAQALQTGEILVAIDRFAFTSNNITYAVAGDQLGYWQFFPPLPATPVEDVSDWGVIPVWGFARVVKSSCETVTVGERLFGYFPPASTLVITPAHVSATRLIDGSSHRASLPPAYNSYSRVDHEPGYDRALDNQRMLLWPLHITSYCLWDLLQAQDWFGSSQIIVTSASSKTSIGLAYALDGDESAPDVTALTSSRHQQFVSQLGLYDRCITYDELATLDASQPSVIIDMSGSGKVLAALQAHLGENMKQCINVGLTHWDETASAKGFDKSRSQFFFAPSHIQKRIKEWGADGFARRSAAFLQGSAENSRQWLHLKSIDGLRGLASIYHEVCEGKLPADTGLIVELQQDS